MLAAEADLGVPRSTAELLARSRAVVDRFGFLDSWFEEGPEIEQLLGSKRIARAKRVALVRELLPKHATKWGDRLARIALLLRHCEDEEPWQEFFVSAKEVLAGRSLAEVPLMNRVAENTVDAYGTSRPTGILSASVVHRFLSTRSASPSLNGLHGSCAVLLADRLHGPPLQVVAHRILPSTGHEVPRAARVSSKRSRQTPPAQPQAVTTPRAHPRSQSAAAAGDHPPGSAGQQAAGSRAPAGLPHVPRPTPAQQPAQTGEAHGLGPLSSRS